MRRKKGKRYKRFNPRYLERLKKKTFLDTENSDPRVFPISTFSTTTQRANHMYETRAHESRHYYERVKP